MFYFGEKAFNQKGLVVCGTKGEKLPSWNGVKNTQKKRGKSLGSQAKYMAKKSLVLVRVEPDIHKTLSEEFRERKAEAKQKGKKEVRKLAVVEYE